MSGQIISQFHTLSKSETKSVDAFSCPKIANFAAGTGASQQIKE